MPERCSTCLSVDRKVIPIKQIRNKSIFLDWSVKLQDMVSLTNLSTYTKRTYDKIYNHDVIVISDDSSNCETKEELNKADAANNNSYISSKNEENPKALAEKTEATKIKEKQDHENNNANDSKTKNKRKYENNSDSSQCNSKQAKQEIKESDITNTGQNIGTSKQPTETNEKQLKNTTDKNYTVLRLTEEKMLKVREKDRNSPRYKARAYKCEKCILGFTEKHQFKKHIFQKHTDFAGQLVCPICEVRFTRRDFFKHHRDGHYKSYKCNLCEYEDQRRFVIEAHITNKHTSVNVSDELIGLNTPLIYHKGIAYMELPKCDQCGQSFTNINTWKEHAATHKEKTEIFLCKLCNRLYQDKGSYQAHMQFAHPKPEDGIYCWKCKVHFPSLDTYSHHLKDSQMHCLIDDLPYGCDKCHSKFVNKEYLKRHIARAHPPVTHTCEICDKGFSDQNCLKSHLLEKHDIGTKDKICPCCSKGFYFRTALLSHIRTHTGEKPFQCEHCEKRFAVKYTLRKHVQRRHSANDSE